MNTFALGAATALLCIAAQQAHAGVSAPFISGAYYEQIGTAQCPPPTGGSSGTTSSGTNGIVTCALLFQAPPAGKMIALTGVACRLVSSINKLKDVYLAVNLNGSITRKQYLHPTLDAEDSGTFYYSVNEDVHGYLVTAPVRVVFDILGGGGFLSMECQIIGQLQAA